MTTVRFRKTGFLFGLTIYVVLRLVTGALVVVLETPYSANGAVVTDVTIEPGQSAGEIGLTLQEKGLIRSARSLRLWMRWNGTAGAIHAGRYRFEGAASIREVAARIVEGRVLLSEITVIEGFTRWQVSEVLSQAGFGSYEEAWEATGNAALVSDLDAEAKDLEGYLFPDTYYVSRQMKPAAIVEMMVDRFRRVWMEPTVVQAEKAGLSVRDAVIIASLIEAETGKPDERALVSGVYHNRLERRMLLQCDPTLLYALRLEGRTDRNIKRSDFDNESPYNTYQFVGLPPGPVGNPGAASIVAALYPAETDFLYFVGRNDGSHAFSRTLQEHNANVSRYQR